MTDISTNINELDEDEGDDEGPEEADLSTATFDPFAQVTQPPPTPMFPAGTKTEAFDDPDFSNQGLKPAVKPNRNGNGNGDGFTIHVQPPKAPAKAPSTPGYKPLQFLANAREGKIRVKRLVDSNIDSKGFYKDDDGDKVKVGVGECGFVPTGSSEEIMNYIKDVWGGGTYELTHMDMNDKKLDQGIMCLPQIPKPIDGVEEEENEFDDTPIGLQPTETYIPGMPPERFGRPRMDRMGMDPRMEMDRMMDPMGRMQMDPMGRMQMDPMARMGNDPMLYPGRRLPVVNTYRPPEELLEAKKEMELLKQRLEMERQEREKAEKEKLQQAHVSQIEMLRRQVEEAAKFAEQKKLTETETLKAQLEAIRATIATPKTDPVMPMVEMMRTQQEDAKLRWEKELEQRRIEAKERQEQLDREARERAEQLRLEVQRQASNQPKTDPIMMMMENMRLQAEAAQRKWEQDREEQRRRDEREREERERRWESERAERERKEREERERRDAERAERERREREDRERREDERKEKERREREEREERRAERERMEKREEERRLLEMQREEQRRQEELRREEQRRREQEQHMKFLFDQQKATIQQQHPLTMIREAMKLSDELRSLGGGEAEEKDEKPENNFANTLTALAPAIAAVGGAVVNRLTPPEQPVNMGTVSSSQPTPNPNPQPVVTPPQVTQRPTPREIEAAKAKEAESKAAMINTYAQLFQVALDNKDKSSHEAAKAVMQKAIDLNARKNLEMLKGQNVDSLAGFLTIAKSSGLVGGMNLQTLENVQSMIATPEGSKWIGEVLAELAK